MFLGALKFAVGFVGVTLLFWLGLSAGLWWDRRPEGQPALHFHFGPFPIGWTAPESLEAKLTRYQAAEIAAEARAKAIEARQADVTHEAAAAEASAQAVIVTRTQTLLKEVPVYVTQEAVGRCVVPFGFVSLLDAAAAGDGVPPATPAAGQSNDSPSGVGLDTVAGSVVANYGAAHANAEQLSALQAWVKAQGMAPQP